MASALRAAPPVGARAAARHPEWTPDDDIWELYNLDEDWIQANDLAARCRTSSRR